jgi:NDP-sugar pyrophosphorylase family protein
VAGLPAAAHTLARLAAAGCEAAALNLHHLGDAIRARFGDAYAGLPLAYSEEPELLGTLGALYPLRDFLAPADLIVVVNGDSLCRWPLKALLRRHRKSGALATLMLARRADPARFGGGVGIDRRGFIRSLRPAGGGGGERAAPPVRGAAAATASRSAARVALAAGAPTSGPAGAGLGARGEEPRRLVFAGAQVLSPELLARLGPGFADTVRDLYEPLLAEGKPLAAYLSRRRWHDLGTPRRYLAAALDGARGGWPERLWRRSWVAREAAVGAGARLRRVAVEAGARIEPGARVEHAALLPGARIGEGAHVRWAVVGPGAAIPAGTWVERRLISAAREGAALAPGDSRVGGLVYTPLDGGGERD